MCPARKGCSCNFLEMQVFVDNNIKNQEKYSLHLTARVKILTEGAAP